MSKLLILCEITQLGGRLVIRRAKLCLVFRGGSVEVLITEFVSPTHYLIIMMCWKITVREHSGFILSWRLNNMQLKIEICEANREPDLPPFTNLVYNLDIKNVWLEYEDN